MEIPLIEVSIPWPWLIILEIALWASPFLPPLFSFFSRSSILRFMIISMLLLMYSRIWKQSAYYINLSFSSLRFPSLILSSSSVDLILMARYRSMIASFMLVVVSGPYLFIAGTPCPMAQLMSLVRSLESSTSTNCWETASDCYSFNNDWLIELICEVISWWCNLISFSS